MINKRTIARPFIMKKLFYQKNNRYKYKIKKKENYNIYQILYYSKKMSKKSDLTNT